MPADFKKLIYTRFLYTFAVQMQAVILGWQIYDLLNDPLALGLIGLAEAIPAIGLALFAGYIVDRVQPLLAYRAVILTSLISALVVLGAHLFQSQISIYAQAGFLYLAAFLTGAARSFSGPAVFTAVPRMVAREQLLKSTAFMSSCNQFARILGPAVGGIIFGFLGVLTATIMIAFFLFFALITILLIQTKVDVPNQLGKNISLSEELLSGVKFVFSHPILFPALSLDMISVLFAGVTALLPIFAKEILFIGPKGLGVLRAAPAVGAMVMGFYLARNSDKFRTGKSLLLAVTGFGICIFIFGFSRIFEVSFVALVLSGAFDSISMVIRSAAVQLSSPDHMRGKISAVNSIFIGSSNEIGELESGIAAKLLGPVGAVYFGAFVCLVTVATTYLVSPVLRKMDLNLLKNT